MCLCLIPTHKCPVPHPFRALREMGGKPQTPTGPSEGAVGGSSGLQPTEEACLDTRALAPEEHSSALCLGTTTLAAKIYSESQEASGHGLLARYLFGVARSVRARLYWLDKLFGVARSVRARLYWLENLFGVARSVRARLQSCRKCNKITSGFSP